MSECTCLDCINARRHPRLELGPHGSTRMFPECIGTTHLAPTNSQCNACKRYGQRCDRKERGE